MSEKNYAELFKVNAFFLGIYCFYVIFNLFFSYQLGIYAIVPSALLILFIAPVVFVKKNNYEIKNIFSINSISIKHVLLVVLGSVFVLIISQFIANIVIKIYELADKLPKPQILLADNVPEIVFQFFITGLFVPVMEETFFRGFMLGIYRKLRVSHYVIISGILFGLFHTQIHIVLGTAFAGIIWGYFVKYSRSIYASIISHIIFNSAALTVMYLKSDLNRAASPQNLKQGEIAGAVILTLVCFFSLYFILKTMKKDYEKTEIKQEHIPGPGEIEIKEKKSLPSYGKSDRIRAWSPIGVFTVLIITGSVILFFN